MSNHMPNRIQRVQVANNEEENIKKKIFFNILFIIEPYFDMKISPSTSTQLSPGVKTTPTQK